MPKPSDDELRRLYDEHDGSVTAVAMKLGRSVPTVGVWYRRLGLVGKGKGGAKSMRPSDDELRKLYEKYGGAHDGIANEVGVVPTAVSKWLKSLGLEGGSRKYARAYPREIRHALHDGYLIAFSDAHFWTDDPTPAHQALLKTIKKLKPAVIIANGDILDGARISRHDPSGLTETPTLEDELHCTVRHVAQIKRLSGGAATFWTLGNHDARLSSYIARQAPELLEVSGARLEHHILGWTFCWSVRINDELLVMHRFRGGQHATFTNTLRSGLSIATGHTHSQRVYPFSDARGTRWGVDLGCLAEIHGPQFSYTEANPMEWRSGFGVFEFRKGKLLPPMLVTVLDDGSVCWQQNQMVA